MKVNFALYLVLTALFFSGCGGEITEEKVRKTASRSNEINHEYIGNQREIYVKKLEKRIEMLDKDLEKLRDVSAEGRKGADIEGSVQQLSAEKALLEGSLRMLHEKTENIDKQMEMHYNRYNYALDSLLKDADAFLATYKTENASGK
ncbi:MAG: hypothetical protein EOP53_05345 [Sphingobacteriales bacterium]|nr:MAG: hypothetical protein EOP53_05345 [Sphingobacteriales bacterium]